MIKLTELVTQEGKTATCFIDLTEAVAVKREPQRFDLPEKYQWPAHTIIILRCGLHISVIETPEEIVEKLPA